MSNHFNNYENEKKNSITGRIVKAVPAEKVVWGANKKEFIKDHDNIAWIEGYQGYTKAYTQQQQCYAFSVCLKYFEKKLPSHLFLRCDHSYLINTAYVKTYFAQCGKIVAVMNDLNQVPVSPEKLEVFAAMVLNNRKK